MQLTTAIHKGGIPGRLGDQVKSTLTIIMFATAMIRREYDLQKSRTDRRWCHICYI